MSIITFLKHKNYLRIQFALVFSIMLSGCVTTKKSKEEVGWLGKKMHDMNARYNGYFNANELVKAGIKTLNDAHVDNFNQVLSVYPYGTEEDRKVIEDNMDLAIEKVVKVAALHEPSKWVDDCYVMMGKAQFLKGDYESAQETFEYFVEDFNPADPDSRVYQAPDRKSNSQQRKKEQQKERKIQEDERKKEREDKEKQRKQEAKDRKKAKKQAEKERKQRNKDRRKGIRTTTSKKEVVEEPTSTVNEQTPPVVASTSEELPLDPDEEYLQNLEREQQKKKEKKIEQGNSGGFLKHKPAYQEGMLWLCKTFIERSKWIEANYFLDKLEAESELLSSVEKELAVVRADFYVRQKDYRNAIPVLESAIEQTNDRTLKARMAFILAQSYQFMGQASQAMNAFDRVSKYKAGYNMELQAELNMLKNSWAAGSTSSEQIERKLNRKAKEDKNQKYSGSIYSTIAEVKLAEGKNTEAMDYFQKALQTNSDNSVKSEIYYRLGTLFYANEDYTNAYAYYDSTLQVMNEKDPRFNEAKIFSTSLKSIAENIEIIKMNDSLLVLGNLTTEELEEYAREKAEKDWQENSKKEEQSGFTATTSVFSGNSKFFAYNQVAKQRGRQDFLKRWGDRPLEDDWRRSNKSSSVFDQEELIDESLANSIPEEELNRAINKILREIPTNEEAQSELNDQIEKSMFELGTGYRTLINNYQKSNQTLLELLKRFPESEFRPESFYFLHLNYLDLENNTMAETFKSRLINEFPQSDFAIYLKNPLAGNVLMTDKRKIEIYYEATYRMFENGQYQQAFDRLNDSEKEFGRNHHMIEKYDLLTAMCVGNISGESEYINALRSVILKYDNTPEQTYAREMLRFLRGDEESFAGEVSEEELSKFVSEDNKLHYVIAIIYKGEGSEIETIKNSINSFNTANYNNKKLRSTSLVLNSENNSYMILIRRFADKNDSMIYYKDVTTRLNDFLDTKKFSYDLYAVNQKNYRAIVQDRSANAYRQFFDNHYLGLK